MSRLDSFIRRMSAQRDLLDHVSTRLDVSGMVCEFGLGSGRTYDHLRERFPDRRIVVFDLVPCGGSALRVSPRSDLIIGDIRHTSERFADGSAALIHTDIETGDPALDAPLAGWLPQVVARLLTVGGLVVSSSALADQRLARCPLPASVDPDRYFLGLRV